MHYAIKLGFLTTNNVAECESMMACLNLALQLKIPQIETFSDSQLMVNQIKQTYQTKDARLTLYVKMILKMLSLFEDFSIHQIPYGENTQADSLAKLASSRGHQKLESVP